MTVSEDDDELSRGCGPLTGMTACDSALTSDSFTLGSLTYEIESLTVGVGSAELYLVMNRSIPEFMQENLVLDVAGRRFALANGIVGTSLNTSDLVQWTSSGLSWADGSTIRVGFSVPAPPFLAGTQRTWNSTPVWKSILTVPDPGSPTALTHGCQITPRAARCAIALTNDSFHVPGNRTYRVTVLLVTEQTGALPNNLELQVDQPIPENQQRRLTLLVDNRRLHFDNASSIGGTTFIWDVPGLSWSEGDHILFGMEQRYQFDCAAGPGDAALNPTDLQAFPGLGVLTLGWINPDTNKHVNYLVRWREQRSSDWLNANGSFGDLGDLGPRLTHHITGLERGVDYEVQVRLLMFVQGCDSSSEWVSATGTTMTDAGLVWSSDLTVGSFGGGNLGCEDGTTSACSSALDTPTFTYKGTEYRVNRIHFTNITVGLSAMLLSMDQSMAGLAGLSLEVDGVEVPLSASDFSTHVVTDDTWDADIDIDITRLSAGSTVRLKLLGDPNPTKVTVTASGPMLEGGPPVNVFFTLDQPALADYGVALGYNFSSSPATALNLPEFAVGARTAVMAMRVPEDHADNNCRNAVYSISIGDSLYAEFAFPVKDNDDPADPCTGVLGSHVPTTLTLEQISVDGTPKFDDNGNWEYGFIYVTLRARLDRASPFHDTVVVDTGSGTTAVASPDPYDGSVGYFRMLNTRMPVPSGSDRPSYTGQRGKTEWTVTISIHANVWYSAPGPNPGDDYERTKRPATVRNNPDHNIQLTALSERYGLRATPLTLNIGKLLQHLRGGGDGTPCANCGPGADSPSGNSNNQAPTVASPLADVSGLAEAGSRKVSLTGVFEDPDGDALTFTARSSNDDVVRALVSPIEDAMLLVGGIAGTATVTVTAEDVYGNQVSDAFEVTVGGSGDNPQTLEPFSPYAELIAKVTDWRNDQRYEHLKPHTDRWDRVLKALGETVADTTLTAMPADEAQDYADRGSGWERWVEVATALKEIEALENQAPTVSTAIVDLAFVNESGSSQVSLSGVFDDADNDSLTITAAPSDTAVATVSVASDGSSLTVSAQGRGTATITVTADDGRGGTVDDTFTVTVKAAPVVASAISDISGLELEDTQDIDLSAVFSDADGDTLTITASSSDDTTVSVFFFRGTLSVIAAQEGTATITVTAEDSDGNTVTDAFEVEVVKKYAGLIADVREWRNDTRYRHLKPHTDRWDRVLKALGETVADTTLTAMPADEAQGYADRGSGWERWVAVAQALKEIEDG